MAPLHNGPMTCRDEILTVVRSLVAGRPGRDFTVLEVVDAMRASGSRYAESTVRTHVTSLMCADAPQHHGTKYADFEHVGHGRYRLR